MNTRAVIFDMFETLITHYASPLYFGAQMAADAGMAPERFQALWRPTESARTVGKATLEEVLESILRAEGCYSPLLLRQLVEKRIAAKQACFAHLHPQILPLLQALRANGVQIGLISNCFSEEAPVIRQSVLFPYFDAACLSYEMGLQKPDPAIFSACMQMLGVQPAQCLYVGDGGSHELEAAQAMGMHAVQAGWYLAPRLPKSAWVLDAFPQAGTPLSILDFAGRRHAF